MNTINCERRIYNCNIDTHTHLYAQLILPIHGDLHIETPNKKLNITNKHLFFLPSECEHTFISNTSNEFLVLNITTTMVNKNGMDKMAGGKDLLFYDNWKAIRHLFLNEY